MNFRSPDGKIKVLRVITRLIIGGPSLHVINLNTTLDSSRFESLLVCGTENPGERSLLDLALSRGIKPIVIPEIVAELSLKPRDVRALKKLYRLIRKERPRIVHTHTAKAGFLGRLAARFAAVPVVIHTYHGHILDGYFGPFKTWLLRKMEWVLALLSDRLIAVSEQVKRDLVAYGVAPAGKISVIPLGLELEPFLNCKIHQGEFRRELGLDGGSRLIGIVGRIAPIKNHRLFISAAARVAPKESSARFVIVGDGISRPELEDYTRELGIADRVIFTGWRRDLPRIYADLDILVVSSDNEGTPVSAIEAMASGCPVVATRVGGVPDLINHGETGYLVPPKNADELAAAILRILHDPEKASRVRQSAQALVQDRFRVQDLITRIENLYQELLGKKSIYSRHATTKIKESLLKRSFDALLSGLGLIGSAPLWVLFAALIKFEDGGPVFYRQERVGKDGRIFFALKFRSMVPNAEAGLGPVQAGYDDPRVTRIGRFLRATAMDELPQLLNIFIGDMSFVGPRALRPMEIEIKNVRREAEGVRGKEIPDFHLRHRVQPGLTGLAQIYAPRDATRRRKLRYDLLYVRSRSFWLDLKLIALSFWITFRGRWEARGKKI
jgi:lipopolysaccharide/colanic/teichoic acid biosynthesis glycosyltransferase/glycosyltransferase involved in cell wall biosynthesis